MSRTNIGSRIYVWDIQQGREIAKFESGHDGIPLLTMNPQGDRIISAGRDGTMKLWDFTSHRVVRSFSAHAGGVNGIDFSQDGRLMATSGADKTVKVWDFVSGRCLHAFQSATKKSSSWVSSTVRFSPDSLLLFSLSDEEQMLEIWEIESGENLFRWKFSAYGFWITPDSSYLVSSNGVWYLDWELDVP